MHVLSLSPHPPHPAVYILVYKTCSESLESICLCGFIKNYPHAMQRVEITIMWCPSDVIAFSILWVFNPHLSPPTSSAFPPPPSTLWNSNHSRIYQWFLHHVFIYWFRIHTHTHTHTNVRVGSVPKPSPSIPKASAIFFVSASKMKAKIALFQLISASTERAVHAGSCFFNPRVNQWQSANAVLLKHAHTHTHTHAHTKIDQLFHVHSTLLWKHRTAG